MCPSSTPTPPSPSPADVVADVAADDDDAAFAVPPRTRVNVFVRVRPAHPPKSGGKKGGGNPPASTGGDVRATRDVGSNGVRIAVNRKSEKTFRYDTVFGEGATQRDVYAVVGRPVIDDVLRGYNGCIMAYGQTGAGKTHSLLNMSSSSSSSSGAAASERDSPGLVPRVVADLFIAMAADYLGMFTVSVAMCQIYNEQIDDLLKPKNVNLRLVKASSSSASASASAADGSSTPPPASSGSYDGWEVEGLSWYRCKSPEYLLSVISNGRKRLVYAETNMNKHSSRSHAVLMIKVVRHSRSEVSSQRKKQQQQQQADGNDAPTSPSGGTPSSLVRQDSTADRNAAKLLRSKQGILSVVDLAGSERVKKSRSEGLRFKEAKNINTSLLALGQCVQALAFKQKHIPYRESILTKFLEPSLCGRARLNFLVCCAPEREHANESMSSLEFAYRAMSVPCSPTVNEMTVCMDPDALIADLASSQSVVKIDTQAMERITAESMRLEEENERLTKERQAIEAEGKRLQADGAQAKKAHREAAARLKAMDADFAKLVAEALVLKQSLLEERQSAREQQERSQERVARLTMEKEAAHGDLERSRGQVARLQEEMSERHEQIAAYAERVQWMEGAIDRTREEAGAIADRMQAMQKIIADSEVKIGGLEEALQDASNRAKALGERSQLDHTRWRQEKTVLAALIKGMRERLVHFERMGRAMVAEAVAAALVQEIVWAATDAISDKALREERAAMSANAHLKAVVVTRRSHLEQCWLRTGVPVIKWGRNERPYARTIRVSADGACLELCAASGGRSRGIGIGTGGRVRSFPLDQVRSMTFSCDAEAAARRMEAAPLQFGADATDAKGDNATPAPLWSEPCHCFLDIRNHRVVKVEVGTYEALRWFLTLRESLPKLARGAEDEEDVGAFVGAHGNGKAA